MLFLELFLFSLSAVKLRSLLFIRACDYRDEIVGAIYEYSVLNNGNRFHDH